MEYNDSGDVENRVFRSTEVSTVGNIIEELLQLYSDKDIEIKNQGLALDQQDRLTDVMDPGEVLTALVKDRDDNPEDEDELRERLENVSDCKILIQQKKEGSPIILEPKDIPFDFKMGWLESKKIFMVYR